MVNLETAGGVANSKAICDCGNVEFVVLIRVMPNGSNHIVALRCPKCLHELVVPFQKGGSGH